MKVSSFQSENSRTGMVKAIAYFRIGMEKQDPCVLPPINRAGLTSMRTTCESTIKMRLSMKSSEVLQPNLELRPNLPAEKKKETCIPKLRDQVKRFITQIFHLPIQQSVTRESMQEVSIHVARHPM